MGKGNPKSPTLDTKYLPTFTNLSLNFAQLGKQHKIMAWNTQFDI